MFYDFNHVERVGSAVLDASGTNSVVYAVKEPMYIKRVIFVTTIAQTVANATITAAVRDVDNGNSVTLGTFVLPYSGSALDQVQFINLAKRPTGPTTAADGSIVYESFPVTMVTKTPPEVENAYAIVPGGLIYAKPGQEFVLTSDGGGDAGSYDVYVEYYTSGLQPGDGTELAFTAA